ncbi:hypothetical protein NLU13_2411 [Sarocladium strictum]|uniref:beta-glucosidase n=1 Tax=Sarocladium strictum TaxID=5046 RepID=A0AA39GST2_SARSR|nr:hypothetical protein NLU13_2411 [Sarocladium strictum]
MMGLEGLVSTERSTTRRSGKKVALLGYAKEALAHGGGSASVTAHYKATPWDALHEAFEGSDVEFVHAFGAHVFGQLPPISSNVTDADGEEGWSCTLFEPGTTQEAGSIEECKSSEIDLLQQEVVGKDIKLQSTYVAPHTGKYYATLSGLGLSKFTIDGKLIAEQTENCSDPMGFVLGGVAAPRVSVDMEAGRQYNFEVTTTPLVSSGSGFGLSYTTFEYADLSVRGDGKDAFVATVKVANTGAVDASTAVQLYVGSRETKPEKPSQGAVPVVTRDFAFWSEEKSQWFVEEGPYSFSIGKNARDVVLTQEVTVPGQTWDP